jgi:hypothetical protein
MRLSPSSRVLLAATLLGTSAAHYVAAVPAARAAAPPASTRLFAVSWAGARRAPSRPSAPLIQSPTHPDEDRWYTATTVRFTWVAPRHGGPAVMYAYAVDRRATTQESPPATVWHQTTSRHASAAGLADGLWYLHVRAGNAHGDWSPVASYAVHIDHAPSRVVHAVFSVFSFNPQFDQQSVRLTFSGPGTLHAAVWNAKVGRHVRTFDPQWVTAARPITLTWGGKDDAGSMLPAGSYGLVLVLSDRVGQHTMQQYWGLGIDYRRIVISLQHQQLWAFDGQTQVLTTLVTTGNKVLPTPLGVFHVTGRFHPYTFISPWPKKSIYYYPPSVASYALYFHQGGYFIHDASWRSTFGPGTNAGVGVPGQSYTGTHGCINVPPAIMPALFAWALSGTVVQIVN